MSRYNNRPKDGRHNNPEDETYTDPVADFEPDARLTDGQRHAKTWWDKARADGLRFHVYLPPDLADSALGLVECGGFQIRTTGYSLSWANTNAWNRMSIFETISATGLSRQPSMIFIQSVLWNRLKNN